MYWLGRIPFQQAILYNAEAVSAVRAGGSPRILAFEPDVPVFTLGRRAATPQGRSVLTPTLDNCAARGVAVLPVDRGGLGTLHLPGQVVLFVALPCLREQLRGLVRELIGAAASVARGFGVAVSIDDTDRVGLWCAGGKLASIGLAHSGGVVAHGLALNVAIDIRQGHGMVLCGSGDTGLASLHRLSSGAAGCTPHAAAQALAQALHAVAKPWPDDGHPHAD